MRCDCCYHLMLMPHISLEAPYLCWLALLQESKEMNVEDTVRRAALNASSSEPNVWDFLSWTSTRVAVVAGAAALFGGLLCFSDRFKVWRPRWLRSMLPAASPAAS